MSLFRFHSIAKVKLHSMDSQNGVKVKDETEERDDIEYYSELHESAIVNCDTTAGPFAIELHKEWSPIGYDRAVELFERGFYDNSHFFRVVPNFLVQFGMRWVFGIALSFFFVSITT